MWLVVHSRMDSDSRNPVCDFKRINSLDYLSASASSRKAILLLKDVKRFMSKIIIPLVVFLLAGFMIYRTWTNHKAADANFAAGQHFLTENGQREDVITTDSGLQYQVLQAGNGTEHPGPKSRVKVHYHGELIDGTVFDSSVARGEPISFGLNQVIKGWQEGVQLMVVGEKTRFYVPSNLGYGKSGTGPIPPSAVLIFEVELLAIE